MNELIAKKYVKALLQACNTRELNAAVESLKNIANAFTISEFDNIIKSPDVDNEKKVELIASIANSRAKKLNNFIKLLNEHDRLSLIPIIHKELESQIALKNNIYEGSVIGDFEVEDKQVKELEKSFSKKFDANVRLESHKTDYPGIKIALDSLGVEASFSLERLKTQIAEHILKAI